MYKKADKFAGWREKMRKSWIKVINESVVGWVTLTT